MVVRVVRLVPLVVAALAYAVWRYFAAQVYVGDLPPFDLRLYGYDAAQAYLAGLTDAARAVYLGPLHRADLGLMAALTVVLMVPVWRMRWVWWVPALLYPGFDLLENRAVAGLLTDGVTNAGAIATLSGVTGLKFGFLGVAAMIALWRTGQQWRG